MWYTTLHYKPVQDDSSPQSSPCCTQQPCHGIHSLWFGGEGAKATTSTTNHCTGVLQQRGKAKQQSTVRPLPTEYNQCNVDRQLKVFLETPEKVESPTKGCGCRTGCTTNKCHSDVNYTVDPAVSAVTVKTINSMHSICQREVS